MLFVGVWGGFGGLGFYLGLAFDIGLSVFCFRGFFELFSVVRNVLKPWFYIVVRCNSTMFKDTRECACICCKVYNNNFEKSPVSCILNPAITSIISSMLVTSRSNN